MLSDFDSKVGFARQRLLFAQGEGSEERPFFFPIENRRLSGPLQEAGAQRFPRAGSKFESGSNLDSSGIAARDLRRIRQVTRGRDRTTQKEDCPVPWPLLKRHREDAKGPRIAKPGIALLNESLNLDIQV
jgi:hypothetical protein